MKESKYIELLRHYLFEKIDESKDEYDASQTGYIVEIVSTIFSALISTLFAEAAVPKSPEGTIRFIPVTIVLAVSYFVLRKLGEVVYRKINLAKKEIHYETRNPDGKSRKKLIAKFDNVACDGLILAYDFIQMYEEKLANLEDSNLREYYLFEALFYYKKSIDIVFELLNYREKCIDITGGVAKYRVDNVYKTLLDINAILKGYLTDDVVNERADLRIELETYDMRLEMIGKVLNL